MHPRLSSKLICSWGWPRTSGPPASISHMLRLQIRTTMLDLFLLLLLLTEVPGAHRSRASHTQARALPLSCSPSHTALCHCSFTVWKEGGWGEGALWSSHEPAWQCHPPQTAPPTGDKVLRYRRLWGTFSFKQHNLLATPAYNDVYRHWWR